MAALLLLQLGASGATSHYTAPFEAAEALCAPVDPMLSACLAVPSRVQSPDRKCSLCVHRGQCAICHPPLEKEAAQQDIFCIVFPPPAAGLRAWLLGRGDRPAERVLKWMVPSAEPEQIHLLALAPVPSPGTVSPIVPHHGSRAHEPCDINMVVIIPSCCVPW